MPVPFVPDSSESDTMRDRTLVALLATMALGCGALRSQAAQFRSGDTYLLSRNLPALPGFECGGGTVEGIARFTPAGEKSMLWISPTAMEPNGFQYDAYRDRLIVAAPSLAAIDANGTFTAFVPSQECQLFAVVGDGRIYILYNNRLLVRDATGGVRILTEQDGSTSFAMGGLLPEHGPRYHSLRYDSMLFDPTTNSLVFGGSVGDSQATDGRSGVAFFKRVTLDEVGTRVLGPVQFAFASGAGSVGYVSAMCRTDDGRILASADCAGNFTDTDSILSLDPVTMSAGLFAAISQTALFRGIDFDRVHRRAVVYDPWTDVLRGYREMDRGLGEELLVVSRQIPNFPITLGCAGHNPGTVRELLVIIPPQPDVEAPAVVIQSPVDGHVTSAPGLIVAAMVTDASGTVIRSEPAGLMATLPQGGGTATGEVLLPANDGPVSLVVTAVDDVGNQGGSSVHVVVDRTAPSIDAISPHEDVIVGESACTLTVQVTDAHATTVSVGLVSRAVPPGGGAVSFDLELAEGRNRIAVVAVDVAGNAATAPRTIWLDSTAPLVRVDSPAHGAVFGPGNTSIPLLATIDDASPTQVESTPVGVAASLPPGGGIALGTVVLREGLNLLSVVASDPLGRQGSHSVQVMLDTSAPDVAITAPAAASLVRQVVDFHAVAADAVPGSGIVSLTLRVDGSALAVFGQAPFEAQLDTALLTDGPHLLEAVAVDAAGNARVARCEITVDNTPPVVVIDAPLANTTVFGLVPFVVTAADHGSGLVSIVQRVGGLAPTQDASLAHAVPVPSDVLTGAEDTRRWSGGSAIFSATAVDAAGNALTVESEVGVWAEPLAAPTLVPRDGQRVHGLLCIRATSASPAFNALAILVDGVEIGSSTTSPFVASHDTRGILDGPLTIQARLLGTNQLVAVSTSQVIVDNLHVERIQPRVLDLRSNRQDAAIQVELEGESVRLLLPTQSHAIELRVPGASAIPALTAWPGDDHVSGSGRHSTLRLRFDRRSLIGAIRAASAAEGRSPFGRHVPLQLWVDAREQGAGSIEVVGASWCER